MTRFPTLQPDLLAVLEERQQVSIQRGTVFSFGGRALLVLDVKGTDAAAPVIVEELTDAVTLKGQLALWSADGVARHMKR